MGKSVKDNKIENINEIKDIISNAAEKTAVEVIEKLRNKNMIKREMSFYKRIEILLYSYNSLKEALNQKDEDIRNIERYGLPKKSGSIVVYSTSGGISEEDRYMQLIEKYKREKEETKRDLNRIDRALDKIRNDKYFDIIYIKYLEGEEETITDEYIAERMGKDRTTILRNRKRLMNKMITILFPESVRDII
ncbi:hypothetical protein [Clostridium ihumii]|uniref:hypothetical protein n=1 Tax=Clostridium ihumii TaxID=1470356 RepID=UPI00054E216E|nr:hypothetical protein [Clostridium ihumii]